jgi:hypothetical protein
VDVHRRRLAKKGRISLPREVAAAESRELCLSQPVHAVDEEGAETRRASEEIDSAAS